MATATRARAGAGAGAGAAGATGAAGAGAGAAACAVEEIWEEDGGDGTKIFRDAKTGAARELEDVRLPPGWAWRSNWRCDAPEGPQGRRLWRRTREAPRKAQVQAGVEPAAVQKQLLSLQQLLCSDAEHLEALTARIGGNLDSEDLRTRLRLHCALAEVHLSAGPILSKALEDFEDAVLAEFSDADEAEMRRRALAQTREMLVKDFARQRARLETALWSVRDRLRAIPAPRAVNVKSVRHIHENIHLPSTASERATRDQELASEMLLQSTLDVNADFFQEREDDIRDISHDVALTKEIMNAVASNVQEQGEMVDHLDDKLGAAEDELESSCVCS